MERVNERILSRLNLSSRAPQLFEREGRPFVTLSYAQSLDGSIAARRGVQLPLSGEASLEVTHRLRAEHQAILVGLGTILADDPRLDVRRVPGDNPQPVVLDSQLRFPKESALLEGRPKPWIVTVNRAPKDRERVLASAGAQVLRVPPSPEGCVSLPGMLESLGQRGVHSLMVEGGARVITSFLRARRVDYVVVTLTPYLIGGLNAIEAPLFHDEAAGSSKQTLLHLSGMDSARLGEDLILWGQPTWLPS